MYLSLPLPIKKKSKTSIVYVPYDPSQQLQKMVVTLSKEASIAHLQKEVAKMMSVEDPNTVSKNRAPFWHVLSNFLTHQYD